jgi:hypothetical protein
VDRAATGVATEQPGTATRVEPRWPVVLAVLAVVALLGLLPGRIALAPTWTPFLLGLFLLTPMVAVMWTGARGRWIRVERVVTLIFCVVSGAATMANLGNLIHAMLLRSVQFAGLQLFATSVSAWVTNILTFALIYWQMDRGGPEARLNGTSRFPDWLFPQASAPAEDVPRGWTPAFVDYLYLAYSTATAFSTTEVAPVTARAKLLMMLESAISLLTIVVIAARAINMLG